MEKNPLVSVIIPIYNAEKTLKRCVDSILNQQYTDFELILVNDGSKDRSLAICKEYVAYDSRVILISKENAGVSSARNEGLKKAKGTWITFVDSDDYILDRYFDEVEGHDEDLLIRGYLCYDLNGIERRHESLDGDFSELSLYDFIARYVGNTVLRVPTMKFYKRDLLAEQTFPESMKVGEDSCFVFNYLSKCNSYSVLHGSYYIYITDVFSNVNKYAMTAEYAGMSLAQLLFAYKKVVAKHHIDEGGFLSYLSYFKLASKDSIIKKPASWYRNEDIKKVYVYLWSKLPIRSRILYKVMRFLSLILK
jgi:glycosyltransferase involved in cell wall biosynthesis